MPMKMRKVAKHECVHVCQHEWMDGCVSPTVNFLTWNLNPPFFLQTYSTYGLNNKNKGHAQI